jgi:hypothetical protein
MISKLRMIASCIIMELPRRALGPDVPVQSSFADYIHLSLQKVFEILHKHDPSSSFLVPSQQGCPGRFRAGPLPGRQSRRHERYGRHAWRLGQDLLALGFQQLFNFHYASNHCTPALWLWLRRHLLRHSCQVSLELPLCFSKHLLVSDLIQ